MIAGMTSIRGAAAMNPRRISDHEAAPAVRGPLRSGNAAAMNQNDDQGPIDKVKEVGQKAADAIEPTEEELSQSGGPASASSPFSSGERPDEQPGAAGDS